MIPKHIYQTYKSMADLPQALTNNVSAIMRANPEWAYNFFCNEAVEQYIGDSYGHEVLRDYLLINPKYGAARADFFRYLIMYERGGVYLDIKSNTVLPLDETIHANDSYLLCHWEGSCGQWHDLHGTGIHGNKEFQQWHIIAAPRHPYLAAVIDKVRGHIRDMKQGSGKDGVLRITGPLAYTQAIFPIMNKHPHRYAMNNVEMGLRYSCVGDGSGQQHTSIMTDHYSRCNEPVIIGS